MRVGVIDVGSNSLRSLFGEILEDQKFKKAGGELLTTRLGEGLSFKKALSEEAMRRTLKGLIDLRERINNYGAEDIYAFATSAVRDAENGEEFLRRVFEETGIRVELLSGEEEALQNLLGVETGLGVSDNYLLLDIGGGSTEIAVKRGGEVFLKSFPIGALKLKERFKGNLEDMLFFLERFWFEEASLLRSLSCKALNFIGMGGTLSALVSFKEGASFYDIKVVHGKKIEAMWLYRTVRFISEISTEELKRRLVFEPDRAYILLEGSTILLSLMSFLFIPEILVSETNLLWGGLVKKWKVKGFVF